MLLGMLCFLVLAALLIGNYCWSVDCCYFVCPAHKTGQANRSIKRCIKEHKEAKAMAGESLMSVGEVVKSAVGQRKRKNANDDSKPDDKIVVAECRARCQSRS